MRYDERSYILGLWVVFFPDNQGNWIAIVDREASSVWRIYIRFRFAQADRSPDEKKRFVIRATGTEQEMEALLAHMVQNVMELAKSNETEFVPVRGNAEVFKAKTTELPWIQMETVALFASEKGGNGSNRFLD